MASVLNRITTIIRANINDLLDRAEDPEKMLDQILRDMYDGIREAREQVAEAVAQQRLVERDLAQGQELSAKWRKNAEMALAAGDENLARECLVRKRDYDKNAEALQRMLDAQRSASQQLKTNLDILEAKYADLQRDRESLLARYRVVKAQERIQTTLQEVSIYDPATQLSEIERKIVEREGKAAARAALASDTLEAKVQALRAPEADLEIEAELLQLKATAEQPRLGPGGGQ